MEAIKTLKPSNFVGVDLSAVDKLKLPQLLGCVVSDIKTGQEAGNTNHVYHSDEPRYDHTRDD